MIFFFLFLIAMESRRIVKHTKVKFRIIRLWHWIFPSFKHGLKFIFCDWRIWNQAKNNKQIKSKEKTQVIRNLFFLQFIHNFKNHLHTEWNSRDYKCKQLLLTLIPHSLFISRVIVDAELSSIKQLLDSWIWGMAMDIPLLEAFTQQFFSVNWFWFCCWWHLRRHLIVWLYLWSVHWNQQQLHF